MDREEQLAVEVSGLVKSFGKTRAVDGLELAVPAGIVYGVLGPNGAGKTTTIRILDYPGVARRRGAGVHDPRGRPRRRRGARPPRASQLRYP